MKDTLIEINTALLAKEKGFGWPVCHYFEANSPRPEDGWKEVYKAEPRDYNHLPFYFVERVSRPTQSHLQKWLWHEADVHFWPAPMPVKQAEVKGLHVSETVRVNVGPDGPFAYEEMLEKLLYTSLKDFVR
jgi:hypothetical protein